ncbi:hypothetical protein AGMMS4952_21090 [Spirochaetia bacterium]|nr:hypothetical protein AGMMS4952_21090 [Spirochaetia bacterium]
MLNEDCQLVVYGKRNIVDLFHIELIGKNVYDNLRGGVKGNALYGAIEPPPGNYRRNSGF